MITKLHTSYIKDDYIFECKKEDMEAYYKVGIILNKHDTEYCLEHLKDICDIYKVTQVE